MCTLKYTAAAVQRCRPRGAPPPPNPSRPWLFPHRAPLVHGGLLTHRWALVGPARVATLPVVTLRGRVRLLVADLWVASFFFDEISSKETLL